MHIVTLIVEGYGDVEAAPSMVAKIGIALERQMVAPKPIRAGEWAKLRREGELERFVELALSRDPNAILILVDLDDGCASEERVEFERRIQHLRDRSGKPIEVCFAVREYEGWFLAASDSLPDEVMRTFANLDNAEAVRGAKEACSRLMPSRYKETQHQVQFTKLIDPKLLFGRSRSFRRLVRALSNLGYAELSHRFEEGGDLSVDNA